MNRRTFNLWPTLLALSVNSACSVKATEATSPKVPVVHVAAGPGSAPVADVGGGVADEDGDEGIDAPVVPSMAKDATDTTHRSQEIAAKTLFLAALKAFQQGRYLEAREGFLRAYDLSPKPALLYNAANAAFKANQKSEACQLYADYRAAAVGAGAPTIHNSLARQCGYQP